MPRYEAINNETGETVFIDAVDLQAAQRSGRYTFAAGQDVTTVGASSGVDQTVDIGASGALAGATVKDPAAEVDSRWAEYNEREWGGIGGKLGAAAEGFVDSATLGGYSALNRLGGTESDMAMRRQQNPISSVIGGVAGAFTGGGAGALKYAPMALTSRLAARAGGKSIVARGLVEGAAVGAGTGVSEMMLSDDPVTLEGAVSSISSNALYGAGFGAAGGIFGKAVEKGLSRTKNALAKRAATAQAKGGDDALEGAAQFVDDVVAHRTATKASGWWVGLGKKGSKSTAVREAQAQAMKAGKKLRNILNDPKGVARNPAFVGRALREEENALMKIVGQADDIRAKLGPTSSRLAKLDEVEGVLARNRSLQETMDGLDAARKAASAPRSEGIVEGAIRGTVFGAAQSVLPGIAGSLVAGKLSQKVGGLLFGNMGKASGKVEERMASALERFLGSGTFAAAKNAAPAAAAKVLGQTRFAPESKNSRPIKTGSKLGDNFAARAREIRDSVTPDPMAPGKFIATPAARQRIASQFDGIRAAQPVLADKLEDYAAKRLEFLAGKMPVNPGVADNLGGPERWAPPNEQMREFARYVAAAHDPAGVVERMAAGKMTTEDAEALRELYPDMFHAIQLDLIERIPQLRERLPYRKQLMLSIFTGVPVAASMDPRALSAYQASFTDEPGTEGGTQAPQAEPAFGSISRPDPTPAQARMG